MADTVLESTSAPSSAPAATPSPSTPSAGSSTPSVKRPSSFGAALKTAEHAESTDPPDVSLSEPSVDGQQQTPPGQPKVESKWEKNVKSIRAQTRQEVETEWKAKVGWAEGIPREPVVEALQWRAQAKQNPGEFIENMLEEGLGNPRVAPVIYGLLDRLLGQMRPQQAAPTPPPTGGPEADFIDPASGKKFYSAEAMQQFGEHLKQSILQEVSPQLMTVDAITKREHQRALNAQQQTFSTNTLKEVRQLPHFVAHEQEIKAVFKAMRMPDAHPSTAANFLYKAYQQVVGPRVEQLNQQQVLARLKQTAAASTTNPATTGAPTQTKRPKNFGDALRQQEARLNVR